jgi:hypothetical protein
MGVTSGQSAGDLAKDHATTDVRGFVRAVDCSRRGGPEADPGQFDGSPLGWVDAMFMSTSAVCVTGLAVVDPGESLQFSGTSLPAAADTVWRTRHSDLYESDYRRAGQTLIASRRIFVHLHAGYIAASDSRSGHDEHCALHTDL